jgi:hypothetical protein
VVKQEFVLKMKAEEAAAAPVVKGIREIYDRKTASLSRSFGSENVHMQAERLKLTKFKKELCEEIEQCCANTKKVVNGNEKAKTRWKSQDQRCKR